MSVAGLIETVLMAFVLLAPTLMVAVLVSGLSRRPSVAADPVETLEPAEVVGAGR